METSEPTLYQWSKKLSGIGETAVRRLKQFDEEDRNPRSRSRGWTITRHYMADNYLPVRCRIHARYLVHYLQYQYRSNSQAKGGKPKH